jgi:hypothetical protein
MAQLLKLDIEEMFNLWERQKPLRTGAPHASAILAPESEWCVRRHVLSALYPELAERPEEKPWSAHQNAVFLNGWHLHEKYQRLFSDHAKVLEVEQAHFDEVRQLWFTPDVILEYAGLPWVGEIKGYHADHFEKLDEVGQPPQTAHLQCNLYCHLLGIEQGFVLVENKNTQNYKVWAIQVDHELARPYTDRMYEVKGHVTLARDGKAKLPPRKCRTCTDGLAQKCPMRKVCFER